MKRANPQGKGLVPALEAWDSTCPAPVQRRSAQHLLADYCASSLVLAARFDFSPVPGNSYHLYLCGDHWRLSLISPLEWGDAAPGVHVARCELRHDMTWGLTAADDLADQPEVLRALERHRDAFLSALDSDIPLVDTLPFHVAALPFYPRLFASALARSLRHGLCSGGFAAASGRKLLDAAEAPGQLLPVLPAGRGAVDSP